MVALYGDGESSTYDQASWRMKNQREAGSVRESPSCSETTATLIATHWKKFAIA